MRRSPSSILKIKLNCREGTYFFSFPEKRGERKEKTPLHQKRIEWMKDWTSRHIKPLKRASYVSIR